jgi:hypothetical protein
MGMMWIRMRLRLNDWTTGENNYLKVFTPSIDSEIGLSQRHTGKWDDDKYRLETNDTALKVISDYIKIKGLQILMISNKNHEHGVRCEPYDNAGQHILISNNIIKAILSESAATNYGITAVHSASHTEKVIYIWNNVIYDWRFANVGRGISISSTWDSAFIYNNIVYNSAEGYIHNGVSPIAKNNIAQNCIDGFYSYAGSFDQN